MKKIGFSLSFCVAPIILFFPYLVRWKQLGGPDFEEAYLPWQLFLSNQIKQGHFPFWNPFFGLGRPTFAEVENSLLYPLRWILFWNPAYSISIFLAGHFSIAHWGGFRFARRFEVSCLSSWLAGFVMALNGWMFSHLLCNHAYILACVAWSLHFASDMISDGWKTNPWRWMVLLFFEAVFLTQSGNPQMAYYSIFFAILVLLIFRLTFLREKRFWGFGSIAALGTVIVAFPHYLYTAELHSISHRAGDYPWEKATKFILSPSRLMEMVTGPPLWWIRLNESTVYETGIYLGPLVVLLALIAFFTKPKKAVSWSLLATSFFALGMVKPEYLLRAFRLLPLAASFRSPGRFMLFGLFSIAILFGFGLDYVLAKLKDRVSRPIFWAAAVGVILSVTLPILFQGTACMPKSTDRISGVLQGISEIAKKKMGEIRPRVLLDLGPSIPNLFWEHGIEMIPGRSAIFLWRLQQFLMPVVPVDSYDFSSYLAIPAKKNSLVSLFSAPVVATTLPPDHMKDFRFIAKVSPYDLYWDDSALPKVKLFPVGIPVKNREEARDRLWASKTPQSELIYEGPQFSDTRPETHGECRFETPQFELWKIHCRTTAPGFVWVSQAFYPGWKAIVNGQETSIYPGNLLFQSFHVPSGELEIVLRYETTKIKFMLFLALMTMATFLLVGVANRR